MEKYINYVEVPNTDKYIENRSMWVNGKITEFDEGIYSIFYIDHREENIVYDDTVKTITLAYPIRVKKPITQEKIITAAVKDAFGLTSEEDFSNFQARLLRLFQTNPKSEEIIEYNNFINWVENGLVISKGITVECAKDIMIRKIEEYDTSINVNSFSLNGHFAWLDKHTRTSIMNTLSIEKASGFEVTTLWLGTQSFELNIDTAIDLLMKLELYAKQCYNKTAEHKYNLEQLSIPEEILEYNYTEGYPEKLNIII